MSKVRWAVVGTSDFALDWIARGISLGSNAELVAVVSRDAARGAAAAQRVGAPFSYTSIDTIDMAQVDGVFLVLPNLQHAPQAVAAAKRGLHVIGEKPMAPTLDDCRQMINAARENNVVLAIAQCMEWAPPIVKARELVAAGAIGVPISATITASYQAEGADLWRQGDSTEAGGGPLLDMGVHAIDSICRVLGPADRVAAFLEHKVHQYNAEDSSTLLVRMASGAHVTVQSYFSCDQNSLEIQGTKGRIWSRQWWGRDFSGDLHMEQDGQVHDFELPKVNVYIPQIEHVSECVLSGSTPVISGERGFHNMAVIWAGIESARTGATVSVAKE